ncbi:MAG: RNA polymerase sigma factor [Candidatus Acidiferrales bacterium]
MAPVTNQPDERLLVEAAQRDPARFADLYEHNFERVYAYVSRRLTDRGAAEDVTAEVFHQALANLDRFEWRGTPFVAWLLRIAANAIVDYWRRTSREQQLADDDGPESFPVNAENIEQVERRAMLFRLVGTLPADQRRVIELRFAEEKPIREIARELGRSEGSIKQLQFRAIQSLREKMRTPSRNDRQVSGEANG